MSRCEGSHRNASESIALDQVRPRGAHHLKAEVALRDSEKLAADPALVEAGDFGEAGDAVVFTGAEQDAIGTAEW